MAAAASSAEAEAEPPPAAEGTADRRQSCQAAASAIQQAQQNDILLNIADSRTVLELADELEEAADAIERIAPTAGLRSLRELLDQYSGTTRSMAKALAATADANSVEARKAPLDTFRDLEPRLHAVINDIGAYCNADG